MLLNYKFSSTVFHFELLDFNRNTSALFMPLQKTTRQILTVTVALRDYVPQLFSQRPLIESRHRASNPFTTDLIQWIFSNRRHGYFKSRQTKLAPPLKYAADSKQNKSSPPGFEILGGEGVVGWQGGGWSQSRKENTENFSPISQNNVLCKNPRFLLNAICLHIEFCVTLFV